MAAAPRDERLHRCSMCFKGYKRREHLHRHWNSHNTDRPYSCNMCNATFKRTDVLRRHMETCDGRRISQTTLPRNRHACDLCMRQKKACNAGSPCQNCQRRGVPCHYSYLDCVSATSPVTASTEDDITASDVPGPAENSEPTTRTETTDSSMSVVCELANQSMDMQFGDDWDFLVQEVVSDFDPNFTDTSFTDAVSREWLELNTPIRLVGQVATVEQPHPSDTNSQGYSFHFLAEFTRGTGLFSSFDCGSLSQRRQVVSSFEMSMQSNLDATGQSRVPASFCERREPLAETQSSHDDHASSSTGVSGLTSNWQSWLDYPIIVKLQQIVLRIKEVVVIKPRNSTVTLSWSPVVERRCLDFFSVPRIGKFLELYWSIWHPNVNFLHRPTFDPVNTPTTLLAAMAVMGACVSPDSEDSQDAKLWFNCVEEMVFTDDHLCSDTILAGADDQPAPSSILIGRRKLQALQAAYIVCLYQNWEGTDASKRRIRRYRFGLVVSVARDIGISTARHAQYYNLAEHEFSWQDYVAREELIRTFIWILLLDSAFVIFNNLPHRMVIKEMAIHMASPEACFQASTSESCLQQIRHWMPDAMATCNTTLRDAIENLCVKTLSAEAQRRMAELGPLNLFAILSAFHYMIFQHQNLTGVDGQLILIRNALGAWRKIWDSYRGQFPVQMDTSQIEPCDMWKRIGFIRHCAEYWLLASLLVAKISSATSEQHRLGKLESSDRDEEFCHATIVEPVLDKYDQTSMRQVNDLITNFRNFQL